MIFFRTIILLHLIGITIAYSTYSEYDYWDNFVLAFGENVVSDSFSSPYSLKNAVELDRIDFINSQELGCMSYTDGQILAKTHRGDKDLDSSLILPFYVDESKDKMCFLLLESKERSFEKEIIFSSFQFASNIPLSFKISPSFYKTIELMLSDMPVKNIPEYLTIEFFNLTASLTGEKRSNYLPLSLKTLLNSLKNYNFDRFDNFYWVKINPNEYPYEFLSYKEKNRVTLWNNIKSIIVDKIDKTSSLTNNSSPFSDPCFFDNLNFRTQKGKISFKTDKYIEMNDPSLAAACFAYLTALASQDSSTYSIAFAHNEKLLNFRSRSIEQSSSVGYDLNSNPYSKIGLLGNNVIISIADSGLDEDSCYFNDPTGRVARGTFDNPITDKRRRKVVQYTSNSDTSDVVEGHGTHVCGTAVGNNKQNIFGENGKYSGVAPNAKIAFMDVGIGDEGLNIPDTQTLFDPGFHIGSKIWTFSWGSDFYKTQSCFGSDYDSILYDNPDMIVFFAAGNNKESAPTMTLTQQGTIKNVVTVGASENTYQSESIDYIAYFSSNGPTYDGRIKPDIVAPGLSVESARSNGDDGQSCEVTGKIGTSMASPGAAGSAALIMEYFANSKYWATYCNKAYNFCKSFLPSGVLVKTLLLHSGSQMKMYNYGSEENNIDLGPTPDIYQGFGRITLANILPLPGKYDFDLFIADLLNINENSNLLFKVNVKQSNKPLRVTISWYDPPNTGSPSKVLLSNLDLILSSPSGKKYYGNRGSINKMDSLNNNEQITVQSPSIGIWNVKVQSKALPFSGSQKFSIAITSFGNVNLNVDV